MTVSCGLFSLILSSSLNLTLANISSTSPWADFSSRLMKTINIELDEEKFKQITVIATAYSSTPDQTDSTPFTTAFGTSVRDGIIAANFLSFNTKIKIPALYGDKIFSVEDRMNSRFNKVNPPRIDVWFPNRYLAKNFGVKKIKIVILD